MSKLAQLCKISVCTVLALNLALIQSESAQAAEFSFSFEIPNPPYDIYNISPGGGTLSFESSPLTGVGAESIKLSELNNYAGSQTQFDFGFSTYSPFLGNGQTLPDNFQISLNDATFKFQSGGLIGIVAEGSTNNVPSPANIDATVYLSLFNASYSTSYDYTETIVETVDVPVFDDQGNIIGYQPEYQQIQNQYAGISYVSGDIGFTTIERIEAVPEPLTMLGIGTACGFGSFFKRELNKKKKGK